MSLSLRIVYIRRPREGEAHQPAIDKNRVSHERTLLSGPPRRCSLSLFSLLWSSLLHSAALYKLKINESLDLQTPPALVSFDVYFVGPQIKEILFRIKDTSIFSAFRKLSVSIFSAFYYFPFQINIFLKEWTRQERDPDCPKGLSVKRLETILLEISVEIFIIPSLSKNICAICGAEEQEKKDLLETDPIKSSPW